MNSSGPGAERTEPAEHIDTVTRLHILVSAPSPLLPLHPLPPAHPQPAQIDEFANAMYEGVHSVPGSSEAVQRAAARAAAAGGGQLPGAAAAAPAATPTSAAASQAAAAAAAVSARAAAVRDSAARVDALALTIRHAEDGMDRSGATDGGGDERELAALRKATAENRAAGVRLLAAEEAAKALQETATDAAAALVHTVMDI